jgi:hypothetical protein
MIRVVEAMAAAHDFGEGSQAATTPAKSPATTQQISTGKLKAMIQPPKIREAKTVVIIPSIAPSMGKTK